MRILHVALTLDFKIPFRAGFGMLALYRGALGAGLRRVACFTRREDCSGCEARGRCVYSYVFETPVPPNAHPLLAKYPFAPHPFVLKPVLEDREKARHVVGITLFGRAVSYLSFFVHVFVHLGRDGLGEERRTFKLTSVLERRLDGTTRELYDPSRDRLDDPEGFRLSIPRLDAPPGGPGRVTVEFLTPYRFRDGGRYSDAVDARSLSSHAARRVTELFEAHGERNEQGYAVALVRDYLARVSSVRTEECDLKWSEIRRFSARQKKEMTLGGVTGSVTFEGDVAPLIPLLRAAEHLSIGKSTSFGFGQVRVYHGQKFGAPPRTRLKGLKDP